MAREFTAIYKNSGKRKGHPRAFIRFFIMKRRDLIESLLKNKCVFIREGAKHSVFFNPLMKKSSTIPRYNEIEDFLAKKICRDLGIEP